MATALNLRGGTVRTMEAFAIHEDDPVEGEEEELEAPEDEMDSSSSEDEAIDTTILRDMKNLEDSFPDFKKHYRLIKRIGHGKYGSSWVRRPQTPGCRFARAQHV